jgi:hypothetical protein
MIGRDGDDRRGAGMGGIIESDTAGEFVWGVWNRAIHLPSRLHLVRFPAK